VKFNITADGHKALVDLETDGKGGFSGSVESYEFGTGGIGGSVHGSHYVGSIILDGHAATFDATVYSDAISGTIKSGWFFRLDFTGTAA